MVDGSYYFGLPSLSACCVALPVRVHVTLID